MIYQVFSPSGNTVNIAANTGSQSVALTDTGEGAATREIRVHNAGTVLAFVAFGNSAVTAATATAMPVPAGAVENFSVAAGCTHAAVILATGTATVYFTSGRGL